jgi:hypothetical protein
VGAVQCDITEKNTGIVSSTIESSSMAAPRIAQIAQTAATTVIGLSPMCESPHRARSCTEPA